jgi:ABC-type transport system involved in multi-copper enzyme maturation permease subunit
MRLVRASLLKLVRRPATLRTLLVMAIVLALLYLTFGMSAGTATNPEARSANDNMLAFPEAYMSLASMLLAFAGIAGAGYAGTVAASEWSWSTFRAALARGESRVRYVLGLFVAIALLTLVAWLALYVVGIGLILLAATIGGVHAGDPFGLTDLGVVPVLIASGGWAVLMQVGIGFAVSFISRSAVAGIATVVGLVFLEQFAAMLAVPADLLRFAPVTAATSLVKAAGDAGLSATIGVPLAVTTIYLLLTVGMAAAVARRAQVA